MADAAPRPGGGAPADAQPVSDAGNSHARARALTEQALDKLVEGDDKAAQGLVDRAKKIDPSGAQAVLDDLNEDAARGEQAVEGQGKTGSVADAAPG